MSETGAGDGGFNGLIIEALNAFLHDYQILRAIRSFTNEIVAYEKVFNSNASEKDIEPTLLSDYRLLHTIKEVLGANRNREWIVLHDKMIFPLSRDEILVVPFEGNHHRPFPEQISLVLGFDGVGHLVAESVSLRLINKGLDNLINHHQPFAFGVIHIDNYQKLLTSFDHGGNLNISARFFREIQSKLNSNDSVVFLDDNFFAILIECATDINEAFPRLWEISGMSNTLISLGEIQIPIHFSAGYVLVIDPYTTAKEVLDEAISIMYKNGSGEECGDLPIRFLPLR